MKDENYICGVAYLGYYPEEIGNIIEDSQYKGIYEKHSFLNEIKRKDFHSLEGNAFYAIVPAEGVKITVNKYATVTATATVIFWNILKDHGSMSLKMK